MYKIYEGIEVDENLLDDLTVEWHEEDVLDKSLKEWIQINTGLTDVEYDVWVRTGSLPHE